MNGICDTFYNIVLTEFRDAGATVAPVTYNGIEPEIATVAEKGHQLLLPSGDSAMEPCNGSATQWKCAMEARAIE